MQKKIFTTASIILSKLKKYHVSVELFLAVMVLLFTFLNNFSSSKIEDFNKELLVRQNGNNNLLLNQILASSEKNKFELFSILKPPIEDFSPNPLFDGKKSELIEDYEKYEKGLITAEDFFNHRVVFFGNAANQLTVRHSESYEELKEQYLSGTPWSGWKNVFEFFQVSFALLLILTLSFAQVVRKG